MNTLLVRSFAGAACLCFLLSVTAYAQFTSPINDAGLEPVEGQFTTLPKTAATVTLSGTITTADPSQLGRLYRDGIPSTCNGKTCPGDFNTSTTYHYKEVSTYNCSPTPTCVRVTSTWAGDMVHTAAYSNPYNPNNRCQGYLGDIGSSSSGNTFEFIAPPYSTLYFIVQFTASNGTSNFDIVVDGLGTGAPTMTAPPDITLNNVPGQCGASSNQVNLGQPVVVGHNCCPGGVTVTNDAPAFFTAGTPTIVTWRAEDACGNSVTATQTVTVIDTEAPSLWVILWPQFLGLPDGSMRNITAYVSAVDNCPNIDWVLESITSIHPDMGTFPADQPGDISATLNAKTTSFALRAENSPGMGSRLYYVRYRATDAGNRTVYATQTVSVQMGSGFGGPILLSDDSYIPASPELQQNYPNPFAATTSITFRLPEDMKASLRVYDLLGRELAVVTDGDFQAGSHSIEFGASELPEGVYLYKLFAGNNVVTKKMLVVR